MNEIRERLEHGEYEIDTEAVALALIARLVAGGSGGCDGGLS